MLIHGPANKRWSAAANRPLRSFGLALVFAVAAIFVGLVATSGSPLLAGLIAGLIGGSILLARPTTAITVIIALGLTMGALLAFAGTGFEKLTWVVSLLGFFLFIPAALHAKNLRHAPGFVHIALAFVLIALIATMVRWHSTAEVLAGVKHTFQVSGLFFALALLPLTEREINRWRRLLIFIAILQIPFALYEFFVLVPMRGGLAGGASVTDVVAGTFGANLVGGSPNSVMAMFLLMILAFMLSHWKEGLLKAHYVAIGLPFFLLPIALGEIKITFVLLPLLVVVLLRREMFRRPVMFLGVSLIGFVLIYILGLIYIEFFLRKPIDDIIYQTLAYNVYERGYGGRFLNRTTVLTFWWQQQGFHDPVGFLLGHGLGSSFESPGSLVMGHVAARWPNHGIGLTGASTLLWDTGVIGFTLFMLQFPAAWIACKTVLRAADTAYLRADAFAMSAIIPLFFVFVFYNDAQVTSITMPILSGLLLGYLAFRYRTQQGGPSKRGVTARQGLASS